MKLYTQTYGCQMNEQDSARIVQIMKRVGYTATEQVEEADLILLNTCSVRNKAEQKVYSALGRWRELKKVRDGVIIGVGGCVAQQEGEALLRRIPYLDLVFGTQNIHKLPQMVQEVKELGKRPVELAFYRDPLYLEDSEGRSEVHIPKAYVTIMQGCNKVCSFCVVPHVRGREISRPADAIVMEIQKLVDNGIKEVMLLGQNVNSYGKNSTHKQPTFPELLQKIDTIEGLERIRFTTSHPQDLSPELIEAYATLNKLCEHLHLPVQSGSDNVLQRMRRGYTVTDYKDRIQRLRERCPKVALSTDIIVGFSGETDQEFDETLEIIREIEYDEIFSFMYSPRPRTIAAKLYADDVAEGTKKLRLSRVQNLQHEISLKRNRQMIGNNQEILIEGQSKLRKGRITGRTRNNKIVNVIAPQSLLGEKIDVRITLASANSLKGELP